MTIAYNVSTPNLFITCPFKPKSAKIWDSIQFPRVTALMDETSLELTMDCQADLAEVKDANSLTKFLEKYGNIFFVICSLRVPGSN